MCTLLKDKKYSFSFTPTSIITHNKVSRLFSQNIRLKLDSVTLLPTLILPQRVCHSNWLVQDNFASISDQIMIISQMGTTSTTIIALLLNSKSFIAGMASNIQISRVQEYLRVDITSAWQSPTPIMKRPDLLQRIWTQLRLDRTRMK